jgi:hypothetical protein
MTSPPSNCAVLALGLVLASIFGGCGFSDTLTSRGFIAEGDQICINTLVRTGVGFKTRPDITAREFLASLGSAYGKAAAGFRRLDTRHEDEGMRDRVVAGYSSFARRLGADARGPSTGMRFRASEVFSDASELQREMKAYGFRVCGGGGGPDGSRG